MQVLSYLLIIISQVAVLVIVVTDRMTHGYGYLDKFVIFIFGVTAFQVILTGYMVLGHLVDIAAIDEFYAKAREAAKK